MDTSSETTVAGPLHPARAGLAAHLSGLGYSPLSVPLRVNLLAHMSKWLADQSMRPADFDDAAVERYLVARAATHVDMSTRGTLAPVLAYLRSAGWVPDAATPAAPDDPIDVLLDRWGTYLADERGLRATTISYYARLARPFLASRAKSGNVDLAGLTADDVTAFLSAQIPGCSVAGVKLTITALRSLLRFLHTTGEVSHRLDRAVPAQAGYRDSGLPRGLAPDQVDAVIAACDPATRNGRRDTAIVLLMARLGLRAGEVARLALEDIDWRAGTLRVLGKGGYTDLVPLPADVGAALAAHLTEGRPATAADRSVFLRAMAPHRALSPRGIADLIGRAGRRGGLTGVSAHRLRHSVATATLNAGASLEEVAQLLRHRHLSSTTIYAKVDLNTLARIARPWPGPPPATSIPGAL